MATRFTSPKILAPQRNRHNTFAFTEKPWYASVDVYFITQRDPTVSLKYVLALLNSKLYFFWLYREGKRKGEMLELYQKPLSEVPIKRISATSQRTFVGLADQVLAAKRVDSGADTADLERQIDRHVYALYGLSEREITIVEGSIT